MDYTTHKQVMVATETVKNRCIELGFKFISRSSGSKSGGSDITYENKGKQYSQRVSLFNQGRFPWNKKPRIFKKGPILYKLYDRNKALLYIGKTTYMTPRMAAHTNQDDKRFMEWKRAIYLIETTDILNRADMHILEPYLIATLKPKFNKDLTSSTGPTFSINVPNFTEVLGFTNRCGD